MMKRGLFQIFFLAILSTVIGCKPSDSELLEKAQTEALNQRAQLAKYFFLQVIQHRTQKDEVRLNALKGLVDISLTQLSDYPTALTALERMIEEFENEPYFRKEATQWRFQAAFIYLNNRQSVDRAMALVQPLIKRESEIEFTSKQEQSLARIFMAKLDFISAEKRLLAAISKTKDCKDLRDLQLDLVQSFALAKNCDKALEWSTKSLPHGCQSDQYSLSIERAHCFESMGDTAKAMQVFETLIADNPKNARLHFMLESLKGRIRERQKR